MNFKDKDGKEYEILCSFYSEEFDKNYIIYTDNKNNEIYASIFYPDEEEKELEKISSLEEWDFVEGVISEIMDGDDDD